MRPGDLGYERGQLDERLADVEWEIETLPDPDATPLDDRHERITANHTDS